jgi:hypothetical protein
MSSEEETVRMLGDSTESIALRMAGMCKSGRAIGVGKSKDSEDGKAMSDSDRTFKDISGNNGATAVAALIAH